MFTQIYITKKRDEFCVGRVGNDFISIRPIKEKCTDPEGLEVKVVDPDVSIDPLYFYQTSDKIPNRFFISGGSGSGKSFITCEYIKDYHKLFPKNKIVLFTATDDPKFNDFENWMSQGKPVFHKMRIDETLIEDPIELDELHDSLVIFDDVSENHFSNRSLAQAIQDIRNQCLHRGRHLNISTIVTDQQALKSHYTKSVHSGALAFVGFPYASSKNEFRNYLKQHMNFDKELIERIMHLNTRWVLINKASNFVLYQKGAFLF